MATPDIAGVDRRRRRREQTIDEIVGIAVEVMAQEGVAGLSLSEVARRMGIQPPSLYKYFPSKLALYDELFKRGAGEVLAAFRAAVALAEPGWAALTAGTEAIMRWGLDHQVLGQLLNWRPVPGFAPSAEAFAPCLELVQEIRRLLQAAAGRRVQLANQPRASWDQGRFTRLTPQVLQLFRCAYPPQKESRGER